LGAANCHAPGHCVWVARTLPLFLLCSFHRSVLMWWQTDSGVPERQLCRWMISNIPGPIVTQFKKPDTIASYQNPSIKSGCSDRYNSIRTFNSPSKSESIGRANAWILWPILKAAITGKEVLAQHCDSNTDDKNKWDCTKQTWNIEHPHLGMMMVIQPASLPMTWCSNGYHATRNCQELQFLGHQWTNKLECWLQNSKIFAAAVYKDYRIRKYSSILV
jgi:hypothetical protein